MTLPLHLVLVEDDPAQESDLKKELEAAWRNSSRGHARAIKVETLTCEAQFLDQFETAPKKLPDMFVIDLMLEWRQPWVKSDRELPSPPPEMDGAGIRCLRVIRKYAPEVPVLIWTMTNKQRLQGLWNDHTFYLRKDRAVDGDLADVIRKANL